MVAQKTPGGEAGRVFSALTGVLAPLVILALQLLLEEELGRLVGAALMDADFQIGKCAVVNFRMRCFDRLIERRTSFECHIFQRPRGIRHRQLLCESF